MNRNDRPVENKPCEVSQPPELNLLIDRLTSSLDRYNGLTMEINNKLQMIKKHSEPECAIEGVKNKEPNSALEQLQQLIWTLNDYNERSEFNLRHLRTIV